MTWRFKSSHRHLTIDLHSDTIVIVQTQFKQNIMACENKLHLDINGIIRSVAVIVVGLPVALSVSGATNAITRAADQAAEKDAATVVVEELRAEATRSCVNWLVSKVDSKLEREAKNEIDDAFGGEVSYKEACKYILQ